jgi:hypothetical protein
MVKRDGCCGHILKLNMPILKLTELLDQVHRRTKSHIKVVENSVKMVELRFVYQARSLFIVSC